MTSRTSTTSTIWRTPLLAKALVALLFSACNGGPQGLQGDGGDMDMMRRLDLAGSPCTSADTFTAAQKAMLSSCSSGGGPRACHDSSPFSGDLDLTTAHAYASLVGVAASIAPTKLRVKPQDPDDSFLIQKLTDNLQGSEGQPMPLGEGIKWRAPDPTALSTLRCWIALGAQNN
jgi:hypothetical protein